VEAELCQLPETAIIPDLSADQDAAFRLPLVALAGVPSVGTSALFDLLTESTAAVGDWPGTTTEVTPGRWRTAQIDADPARLQDSTDMTVIDLPGAYSLEGTSPEDQVTRSVLADAEADNAPDLVIVVADAGQLSHSLYLLAELREQPRRLAVALTASGRPSRHRIAIDSADLSEALGVPVARVNPRHHAGLDDLSQVVQTALAAPVPPPRHRADEIDDPEDERFAWIANVLDRTSIAQPSHRSLTDRADCILLAPVLGPLVFLAVMWAVFQVTTAVATPLQNLLSGLFAGPVSSGVSWVLSAVGLGNTWVEGLLVHGVVAGVGMLLSFTPLLVLMFILLALLEDSGYLARAAVLTDRVMGLLGLPGQAFLPLIVGFGCNVPAITAARDLPNARQRLLTIMLIPFTACSGRLTVFVMMGTIFFGRWAGTAVFVMYVVSILLVVLAGLIWRRALWRRLGTQPRVVDLPPYRLPGVRQTAASVWARLKDFLRTVSGIIVGMVTLVWLLQAIPSGPGSFGHVGVEDSLFAWLARGVAPLFSPAGFGSWQIVSALAVGFVAKEAIISSWGQTYAAAAPADLAAIGGHLRLAFEASTGGHALVGVAAFMVYLLAYTPCAATLASQRRAIGWRWTALGVLVQLAIASLLAILVFQIGRLIW